MLPTDYPAKPQRILTVINDGRVDFEGQVFQIKADLTVRDALPVPIVIAALAPRMLRMAGELVHGTVTWMAGVKAIGEHVVPRIQTAARSAGRPKPRVIVGLPVAVTDNLQSARDTAARVFEVYGQLTNYRRLLDIEGVEGPSEVAVVGNEVQVEQQLRTFASAGATDFIASILPVGEDADGSIARARSLLGSLVGKL